MKSPLITQSSMQRDYVEELYRQLDMMFDFKSGEVLVGLSTEAQLKALIDKNMTALKKIIGNVIACLTTEQCNQG